MKKAISFSICFTLIGYSGRIRPDTWKPFECKGEENKNILILWFPGTEGATLCFMVALCSFNFIWLGALCTSEFYFAYISRLYVMLFSPSRPHTRVWHERTASQSRPSVPCTNFCAAIPIKWLWILQEAHRVTFFFKSVDHVNIQHFKSYACVWVINATNWLINLTPHTPAYLYFHFIAHVK